MLRKINNKYFKSKPFFRSCPSCCEHIQSFLRTFKPDDTNYYFMCSDCNNTWIDDCSDDIIETKKLLDSSKLDKTKNKDIRLTILDTLDISILTIMIFNSLQK